MVSVRFSEFRPLSLMTSSIRSLRVCSKKQKKSCEVNKVECNLQHIVCHIKTSKSHKAGEKVRNVCQFVAFQIKRFNVDTQTEGTRKNGEIVEC